MHCPASNRRQCKSDILIMKKKVKFSIGGRLRSFKYAANGLKILFSQEHNARIHAVAAVMAVSLAIILGFDRTGWVAVLISIAAVFITESVNSAVERLCDLVMPQYSRQVKEIKDLAAGAVLISAVMAVLLWITVSLT